MREGKLSGLKFLHVYKDTRQIDIWIHVHMYTNLPLALHFRMKLQHGFVFALMVLYRSREIKSDTKVGWINLKVQLKLVCGLQNPGFVSVYIDKRIPATLWWRT